MIYDSMSILKNGEEIWMKRLEEVKKYINYNNKLPNRIENKLLSGWIQTQKANYKTKKQIMSNSEIYKIWSDFINNKIYNKYFISNKEIWKLKLIDIKLYINTNKTLPNKKKNKILREWITTQKANHKIKTQIMSNPEIYKKWTEFINDEKYKMYFISNEEIWNSNLDELKKYIDINNKRPSEESNNNYVKKLGRWTSHQNKTYTKKKEIMSNPEIYNIWTEFINDQKYLEYFISNEDKWNNYLEEIKKYIESNNQLPPTTHGNCNIRK